MWGWEKNGVKLVVFKMVSEFLKGVVGMFEGKFINMFKGMEFEFWSINLMSDFFDIFVILWGFVMIVVMFLGIRSFENFLGVIIDDLMWMCLLMNVGEMYFFFVFMMLFLLYWFILIIILLVIVILVLMMESVKILIIFLFFIIRFVGIFLLVIVSCFFKVVFVFDMNVIFFIV